MKTKKIKKINKKETVAVTFSLNENTIEKMNNFFEDYMIDKSKFIERMISQNIDIISE